MDVFFAFRNGFFAVALAPNPLARRVVGVVVVVVVVVVAVVTPVVDTSASCCDLALGVVVGTKASEYKTQKQGNNHRNRRIGTSDECMHTIYYYYIVLSSDWSVGKTNERSMYSTRFENLEAVHERTARRTTRCGC